MVHFASSLAIFLIMGGVAAGEATRVLKGDKKKKEKKTKKPSKCTKKKKDANTCAANPEALQGVCSSPESMKIILNSCGDVYGPTVVNRAMAASGFDLSSNSNKTVFSEAWSYMATLDPTNVILAGDNVYNDAIANWGKNYHPYGYNMAQILADASVPFMKYHGYLTEDGAAGPLYYSYLEMLKDKLQDGYIDNDEFNLESLLSCVMYYELYQVKVYKILTENFFTNWL